MVDATYRYMFSAQGATEEEGQPGRRNTATWQEEPLIGRVCHIL